MSTIALCVWPEPGHTGPASRLSQKLRARGHRVVWAGLPDFAGPTPGDGIDRLDLGVSAFPRGSLPRDNPVTAILAERARFEAFAHILGSPDALRDACADAAIVDFLLPAAAIGANAAGLPVGMLYTNFPYRREPGVPPLTTGLAPDRSLRGRLRAELAWRAIDASGRIVRLGRTLRGLPNTRAVLFDVARRAGYPLGSIDTSCPIGCALGFPELVLCPAELDFAEARRPGRVYAEPMVGAAPEGADRFPWDRLDPARRLVVCAVGSQSHRYHRGLLERVLREVVAAARRRPDIQLVLAHGVIGKAALGEAPANAVLVPWIPQVALFERAAAVVTHAGLNSVKEAIVAGAPMVAIPLLNDQPGNAARIAHHSLGVAVDPRHLAPSGLDAALARALDDATLRARIAAMGERFLALEAEGPAARFVESLVGA